MNEEQYSKQLNEENKKEKKLKQIKITKYIRIVFIFLAIISFVLFIALSSNSNGTFVAAPWLIFLASILGIIITSVIIKKKNYNPDTNVFIVTGYPTGEHLYKMDCELFDDRFELTAKREAIFDSTAGKKFVIPYDKIEKIQEIHCGVVLGVELFLNDDTIERPLFGKALSTSFGGLGALGGLINGAMHGEGKFKFYFRKRVNYNKFVNTIPIKDKPSLRGE